MYGTAGGADSGSGRCELAQSPCLAHTNAVLPMSLWCEATGLARLDRTRKNGWDGLLRTWRLRACIRMVCRVSTAVVRRAAVARCGDITASTVWCSLRGPARWDS